MANLDLVGSAASLQRTIGRTARLQRARARLAIGSLAASIVLAAASVVLVILL